MLSLSMDLRPFYGFHYRVTLDFTSYRILGPTSLGSIHDSNVIDSIISIEIRFVSIVNIDYQMLN